MEYICIYTCQPKPEQTCTAWREGGQRSGGLELFRNLITCPKGNKGNEMQDHAHESLSLTAPEKRGKIHRGFPCGITPGPVPVGLLEDLGVEQSCFIWVGSMRHRPHQVPFEGITLHYRLSSSTRCFHPQQRCWTWLVLAAGLVQPTLAMLQCQEKPRAFLQQEGTHRVSQCPGGEVTLSQG